MSVVIPDPRGLATSGPTIHDALRDIHIAAHSGLAEYNAHRRGAAHKLAYILARLERLTIDQRRNGDA